MQIARRSSTKTTLSSKERAQKFRLNCPCGDSSGPLAMESVTGVGAVWRW